MFRRFTSVAVITLAMALVAGCHHAKVANPIANLNSKQPDKVLFDRAMDAMQHGHYEQARLALQTLINTYPDSEFVARAKLAVGDSWFAEGCTSCLAQAEMEYKDFQTFFPNMLEAAEAQMKVANIHFRQMEKMDRDPMQALRAEDEYRQLILQYPDSKLVAEAKEKLRMVQEVLAQREFAIGRFYYLRESWPAAIARLESLTQTYPLFSGADEALYMLGTSHEKWAEMLRQNMKNPKMPGSLEQKKAVVDLQVNQAAEDYAKIVTRYPVTDRAGDAKSRLQAMKRPVPTPTPEMIAQNKAEEESRGSTGMVGRWWQMFHHAPNMTAAAGVGEPQLQTPPPVSATSLVDQTTRAFNSAGPGGNNTLGVERVGPNKGTGDQSGGSSGTGNPANPKEPAGITGQPNTNSPQPPAASNQQRTGIDELTPAAPAPAAPATPAPTTANPGTQPAAQPEQPTAPPAAPPAAAPAQPETPPAGTSVGQTGNQAEQPPAQIQTGVSASEAQAKSGDQQPDPKASSSSRSKKKKKKVQEAKPNPPAPNPNH